jgi:hypothetical protein
MVMPKLTIKKGKIKIKLKLKCFCFLFPCKFLIHINIYGRSLGIAATKLNLYLSKRSLPLLQGFTAKSLSFPFIDYSLQLCELFTAACRLPSQQSSLPLFLSKDIETTFFGLVESIRRRRP